MEELYMKKFVCILLIVVFMFSMASVAFARNYIISPEKGNTDVEPEDTPVAPQTGETGTIYWVVAAMFLALGAVIFCGKKLVADK